MIPVLRPWYIGDYLDLKKNLVSFLPQERLKKIKKDYGKISLGDTTMDMVGIPKFHDYLLMCFNVVPNLL